MNFEVEHGDALDVLKNWDDDQFDSVVTDPPAGIGFMEKKWDKDKGGRHQWIDWLRKIMIEVLRVSKPGAHMLCWSLPRTSHWTTTAIEEAGWEIRDVITHHYGSGFPKSVDVSKEIDKKAGAERETIGQRVVGGTGKSFGKHVGIEKPERQIIDVTIPATELAKVWDGWGTGLKPASEYWVLARKPFRSTVADCVEKNGTGTINIDGCRVGTEKRFNPPAGNDRMEGFQVGDFGMKSNVDGRLCEGRWPANLILSHSHDCKPSGCSKGCPVAEIGSFSRFFYVAKPSPREKRSGIDENIHPTVKNVRLMRWLCRLITPSNGLILDPFCGSGSTGCAAMLEGFEFYGIEQNEDYVKLALQRLEYWKNVRFWLDRRESR